MPSPSAQAGSAAPRPPAIPLAATGLGSGVLSGLLGVGGGIVLVPALVSLFRFPQRRAQATSLAAIVLTAIAGAVTYSFAGHFELLPAALIAAGGLGGSFLGAELAARWSDDVVRIVFVVVMIVAGVRLMMPEAQAAGPPLTSGLAASLGFVATGVAMGVLSSLVGVGGGVILVPILILFFHFSPQGAQGTSLLVMIPIAAFGSWRNARHGFTDFRAGGLLGLGGVIGSPLGALAAVHLPTLLLQRVFAVLLFACAAQMIFLTVRDRRRRRAAAQDWDDEERE